jgi:lysophospholipase L1-like esterase
MMTGLPEWCVRVVLVALSAALAVALVEGGMRVLELGGDKPVDRAMASLFVPSAATDVIYEHAPMARVTFPASTSAAGSNPEWRVSTDANGLRRNGEESGGTPVLRGICMGDSIMFGVGLNDVETIPARLGVEVSEKLERRFECLNFGVSNYTTVQEVDFFRHKNALQYAPDIVVLEVFTNDFKEGPGRIRIRNDRVDLITPETDGWVYGFWSSLRVTDVIASAVLGISKRVRGNDQDLESNRKPLRPEQIGAVYGALDELRGLLAARGIPLLVVFFPRDWQLRAPDRVAGTERQRVVRQYCEEHGVPFLDLLDEFYGLPIEAYFRPGDDAHPHARAAQRVAEIISEPVAEILRRKTKETLPP